MIFIGFLNLRLLLFCVLCVLVIKSFMWVGERGGWERWCCVLIWRRCICFYLESWKFDNEVGGERGWLLGMCLIIWYLFENYCNECCRWMWFGWIFELNIFV